MVDTDLVFEQAKSVDDRINVIGVAWEEASECGPGMYRVSFLLPGRPTERVFNVWVHPVESVVDSMRRWAEFFARVRDEDL